jgi:transcriptional regulator with XRE-family HTH domain
MHDKNAIDLSHAKTAGEVLAKFSQNPDNQRLLLESEIRFDLSEFMKQIREEAHLTQHELARRVGRTQPLIAKLEAGAYDRMGFSGVRTYARAIGCDFISIKAMFRPLAEPIYTGSSTQTDDLVGVASAPTNVKDFAKRLEQDALATWTNGSRPNLRLIDSASDKDDRGVAA